VPCSSVCLARLHDLIASDVTMLLNAIGGLAVFISLNFYCSLSCGV